MRGEHEIVSTGSFGFAQYTEDDAVPISFIGIASDKIKAVTMTSYETAQRMLRSTLEIEAVDGAELRLSVESLPGQEPPGWFIAMRDEWLKEVQS